jgi:ion channel-forming bestrophin family protein
MYIGRHITARMVYFFTWRLMLLSLLTGLFAVFLYQYLGWKWVAIPWLPISLIGTAVAFYVGFKNNQAYDRTWEARKIWGGITNLSRSFSASVRAFVTDEFSKHPVSKEKIDAEIKTVLYRHLAWLYALKHAMWKRAQWEHQRKVNKWYRDYFEKHFSLGSFEDELSPFLSKEEHDWVKTKSNAAAQLLDKQSQHLLNLKREGLLDDFRHMELQKFITELYGEQGRSERIKNTPLPRQFATSSTLFIIIFTVLLPFGMLQEFSELGAGLLWLLVPFNMVVSWIFSLMEYIGDYSENPFEGLINDVPIYSIIRNIEIDLKEMMGEESLPGKIVPVHDVII